jgi:hypothetical protein
VSSYGTPNQAPRHPIEGKPPPPLYSPLKTQNMVTIIDFKKRANSEGKEYGVLVIQGAIETVRSQTTNRPYFTAKKTAVPTTFDEAFGKNLIGQTLPGQIEKQECDPYIFTNPETGEEMELSHTYIYNEDPASIEEEVLG